MADRLGQALWPGLPGYIACQYTLSQGTTPGQAVLTIFPNYLSQIEIYGTLVLTDGVETVALPDCKVDRVGYSLTSTRLVAHVYILDGRWRWQFATVSGHYNDPSDRFPPDKAPKKLRELLSMCFDAMGVRTYQLVGVPDSEPLVNWDYEPAVQALSSLCDEHGLRPCWRPDLGSGALVAPLGEGNALPGGSLSDDAPGLDVPEAPESLQLATAPERYQTRIVMEAVGEDFDGTVKLIDELSYRPTDAKKWKRSIPPLFVNLPTDAQLPGSHTQEEARALARKSVFSWYRPKRDKSDEVEIDGFSPDGRAERNTVHWTRIVLTDRLVETVKDDAGNQDDAPAKVFCSYYAGGPGSTNTEDDGDHPTKIPFAVDPERGIIAFSQPMFMLEIGDDENPTGLCLPSEVVLETAVLIRGRISNQPLRHTHTRRLAGGTPGLVKTIVREDVRWGRRAIYDADNAIPLKEPKEYKDVSDEQKAQYYLAAAALQYQTSEAQQRGYNGVRVIYCDGAIAQVSWTMGDGSPCTTRASRNAEHSPYVPPYPQRRRVESADLEGMRRAKIGSPESEAALKRLARARGGGDPFAGG